jgi:hypothetical protein
MIGVFSGDSSLFLVPLIRRAKSMHDFDTFRMKSRGYSQIAEQCMPVEASWSAFTLKSPARGAGLLRALDVDNIFIALILPISHQLFGTGSGCLRGAIGVSLAYVLWGIDY